MPGAVIVTATDARMFWLAKGLVLSIAPARRRLGHDMVCLDLGLLPQQAAWLAAQGVRVLPPADPLDTARCEGFKPYMLAMFCRPFLPRLLPGHDAVIWLDADTWLQDAEALDGLLHVARLGRFACCPEVHPAYSPSPEATLRRFRLRQSWWTATFGPAAATLYTPSPMLNGGIFAAGADHPVWTAWEAELRVAIRRPLTHLSEQLSLCKAALDHAQVERMSALWNWMANLAQPRWDHDGRRWVEPTWPHQAIRIIHLAGARARYLTRALLFDAGAYLAPGEGRFAAAAAP